MFIDAIIFLVHLEFLDLKHLLYHIRFPELKFWSAFFIFFCFMKCNEAEAGEESVEDAVVITKTKT